MSDDLEHIIGDLEDKMGVSRAPRENKYILKDGKPVPEPDVIKWGKWFENHNRKVAESRVGAVQISTVFLGLDHSYGGGRPVLWETMVFGGRFDGYQERYHSREGAIRGHGDIKYMVAKKDPPWLQWLRGVWEGIKEWLNALPPPEGF